MAQTESRSGFRLPWSPESTDTDAPEGDPGQAPAPDDIPTAEEAATPDMILSLIHI